MTIHAIFTRKCVFFFNKIWRIFFCFFLSWTLLVYLFNSSCQHSSRNQFKSQLHTDLSLAHTHTFTFIRCIQMIDAAVSRLIDIFFSVAPSPQSTRMYSTNSLLVWWWLVVVVVVINTYIVVCAKRDEYFLCFRKPMQLQYNVDACIFFFK